MKKKFTIKIDKDARSRIDKVAQEIARLGAKVDKTMSRIGVISATMEESLENKVRTVRDVKLVRQAKIYSVAPPDAPTH